MAVAPCLHSASYVLTRLLDTQLGSETAYLRGQQGQHEALGELLHGAHVHEQGAAPQAGHGQLGEHVFEGQDGAGQDHHVRVLLAQVIGVLLTACVSES